MVRCKMTQGRVTGVSCLLDLAISLDRLSLAMGEQSLKKMGFSWASWTSRMAKSIVVRFVVRKGNLMKNMEERLMASGHPVSWWIVHRYLTNVAEVKATQNHVLTRALERGGGQILPSPHVFLLISFEVFVRSP